MPLKYYECVLTDSDDYMVVPKEMMGEVVKAMEVMSSHGFPPSKVKERILETLFPKGLEPDVCTLPETSKTNVNKDAPPEVIADKRRITSEATDKTKQCNRNDSVTRKPSDDEECKGNKNAVVANLVEEPHQRTKSDNVTRKSSSAGEYRTKKNKEAELSSAEEINFKSNKTTFLKEQLSPSSAVLDLVEKPKGSTKTDHDATRGSSNTGVSQNVKHEETSNRITLDEIFPNSVEESNLDIINQLPTTQVAAKQNKKVVADENKRLSSPVPTKKAKVEIPDPAYREPSSSKNETTASPVAKSEEKKSSIPDPPPFPPCSMKDHEGKSSKKKILPPISETKEDVKERKKNNPPNPALVRKEESQNCALAKTKDPTATPSQKNDEVLVLDKGRENKQRPTKKPMSPSTVHPEAPPKETMMAGGECFASVDGIAQDARTRAASTTSRRTSNVMQQRSRETDKNKTVASKNINKSNNKKSWKSKHLMIAGGIGMAMVCFYAFYKNKT